MSDNSQLLSFLARIILLHRNAVLAPVSLLLLLDPHPLQCTFLQNDSIYAPRGPSGHQTPGRPKQTLESPGLQTKGQNPQGTETLPELTPLVGGIVILDLC